VQGQVGQGEVKDAMSLRLLSVQVGRVAPLSIGDQRVMSGIRKRAVTGPVVVESLGLSDDLPNGSLGENLTVQGLLESELFVGDMLRFPDCELRVTLPRKPCHKFAAVMGDPQAGRAMIESGHCGFYLAVDRPGSLEAGQSFELVAGPRETPLMALFPSAKGKG
jgi:MOSC domain-containing protein YiiM